MPRSEVHNAFNGKRGAPQRRSAAAPQRRSAASSPPAAGSPLPAPASTSARDPHSTPAPITSPATPHPLPLPPRRRPPPWADDGLAFARHWLRSNGSVVLDYEGRLFLSLWRLRAGSVALG